MQVKNLSPNAENPRKIEQARLKTLKRAMAKFGDLGGIIFNARTKRLVGGHQRREILDAKSPVTILKKYSKPTKTGTTAEGFVEFNNERFTYREVYWDEQTEKAAAIAANKSAGSWDQDGLDSWFKELHETNFDLDLTMFEASELPDFSTITVTQHERKLKSTTDEDELTSLPIAKSGDVYMLGCHRLKCGDNDRLMIDKLVRYWEKQTGEEAELLNEKKSIIKKSV